MKVADSGLAANSLLPGFASGANAGPGFGILVETGNALARTLVPGASKFGETGPASLATAPVLPEGDAAATLLLGAKPAGTGFPPAVEAGPAMLAHAEDMPQRPAEAGMPAIQPATAPRARRTMLPELLTGGSLLTTAATGVNKSVPAPIAARVLGASPAMPRGETAMPVTASAPAIGDTALASATPLAPATPETAASDGQTAGLKPLAAPVGAPQPDATIATRQPAAATQQATNPQGSEPTIVPGTPSSATPTAAPAAGSDKRLTETTAAPVDSRAHASPLTQAGDNVAEQAPSDTPAPPATAATQTRPSDVEAKSPVAEPTGRRGLEPSDDPAPVASDAAVMIAPAAIAERPAEPVPAVAQDARQQSFTTAASPAAEPATGQEPSATTDRNGNTDSFKIATGPEGTGTPDTSNDGAGQNGDGSNASHGERDFTNLMRDKPTATPGESTDSSKVSSQDARPLQPGSAPAPTPDRMPVPGQPAASAATAAPAGTTAAPAPVAAHDVELDSGSGHVGRDLGIAIARKVQNGEDMLRVRMNPGDLGRVEVTLAFDDKGHVQATLKADTQAAIELLRRDAADLGRALDQAGVRADPQNFRFESRSDGNQQQQMMQQNGGSGGNGGQHRQNPTGNPANDGDFVDSDAGYRPVSLDGRVDLIA
ncbi:flagellar hook-length control protein FliK [Stakelama tenebrarum]|uniref:Flagellar hook-length control protein-like C-terminal domain-containing protein n=1 Tax=Stakelama tenebrarum TaxID=2711215 RepID=A0A6G6Y505_9SPHN|nr:flagellar hook-length control protein FliK [Sphingosinithalassobacter tenebrarum]QIG79683.1 hypothetical protein G5C33_07680 [Sphingosinithalassobacter tenebrarum]